MSSPRPTRPSAASVPAGGYHDLLDHLEASLRGALRQWARRARSRMQGTGLVLSRIRDFARSAKGVDLSPGMLELARGRGLDVLEARRRPCRLQTARSTSLARSRCSPMCPHRTGAFGDGARHPTGRRDPGRVLQSAEPARAAPPCWASPDHWTRATRRRHLHALRFAAAGAGTHAPRMHLRRRPRCAHRHAVRWPSRRTHPRPSGVPDGKRCSPTVR